MPDVTASLISVGVAIILFEGGMTLPLAVLKMAPKGIDITDDVLRILKETRV